MKKYIYIVMTLVGLSSCASWTPQQWRDLGDGYSQMSRDMSAQSDRNHQQMQAMQPRQCETRPNGYGGWVTQCFP